MALIRLLKLFVFHSVMLFIRVLPFPALLPLGTLAGELYARLARGPRLIGAKAIERCLSLPSNAAREIYRRSCRTFGRAALLAGRLPAFAPGRMEKLIRIEGEEELRRIRQSGSGAVIVTGHFGPFTLIGSRLSLAGYPSGYIMRLSRNLPVRNAFIKKGREGRIELIPSRPAVGCIHASTEHLKKGNFLVVTIDHAVHYRGQSVRIFNQDLRFETGAVSLARKLGIPVVPAFMVPEGRGYCLKIFPAIDPGLQKSSEYVVSKAVSLLEKMVRDFPDQWLWDKNRWQRILPDEDLPFPMVRGWKKHLGHYLGYRGTQLIYSLAQIIPLPLLNPLGKLLGKMAGSLAPSRRKIAEDNLRIAFGKEKSEKEILNLGRDFYAQAGQGAFRLLAYNRISRQIEVAGEQHLREAQKLGRGVILAGGHVSVFPLIIPALGKRNYPINTFFRFPRDPRLGRYVLGHIKNMGGAYLPNRPPRLALERALECLAKNEIIIIFFDQNVHEGGEFIEFFGRPAATTTLPASLALRTQAPILPVFIKSKDSNNSSGFTVTIYPPLNLEPSGDRKADRIRISRDLNQILEARIRENPAQWFWFHRRWKRSLTN
ncbi:MAG: hypothetical protein PHE84_11205 [bacterium]|nr:hypothetical protein [bacterium]